MWRHRRFDRRALLEQQQHLILGNVEGRHPLHRLHSAGEAQHTLIELDRPTEIGDVKRRLDHRNYLLLGCQSLLLGLLLLTHARER